MTPRLAAETSDDPQGRDAPALAGPPSMGQAPQQQVTEDQAQLADAARELQLSEARLRGIFESAIDAIVTVDESQTIVQANAAAARMFRCPLDELVGAPLERFIPERFRQAHRQHLPAFGAGAAVARPMGPQRDVMALRADGEEFAVEAAISRATVGGRHLYTVIHRDITERRQAEQAVRESRRLLASALASMSDAVFISDTEGRFIEFNEAFATIHRFGSKARCPRTLQEHLKVLDVHLANGELAPPEMWAVPRALRGETATNVDYLLRRKDTGASWVGSYSFAPVRAEDGAIVGCVVIGRDVTAQKEVVADLAASHAALQRFIANQDRVQDEERTRVARELHDDLQQTLAALRIELSELARRVGDRHDGLGGLVAQLDALAAQAVASTRRAVEDLRPHVLEDLGLVPALQALAAQFRKRTQVACVVHAPDAIDDTLQALPSLASCLYRVVQEALNNVAKHAQATRVEVRLTLASRGQVGLKVSDNGRGIGDRDRRKPQSFGLVGMQERVRAQGGRLHVERLAAGGTCVEVHVPLNGPAGALAVAADARGADETREGDLAGPLPPPRGQGSKLPLDRLVARASVHSLQNVIDAMAGQIAVLDARGVIRFVNRAWVEFAARNGVRDVQTVGPGVDYLEVCRRGAQLEAGAGRAYEGLLGVVQGRLPAFSLDYPCHLPREELWFRCHAKPMSDGDTLVEHFLLSSRPRAPSAAG